MSDSNHQHTKYRQLIYDKEIAQFYRRLTTSVSSVELKKYIHYDHVSALKDASRKLGLFILVRRTNPESLKFINYPGFIPKPLLCKPKTADRNIKWTVSGKPRQINCAGLVVNPYLLGIAAFSSWKKCSSAMETWDKYWGDNIPLGFSIQENTDSSYYGCVMRGNNASTRVYPHNRKEQGKEKADKINMVSSPSNTFIDTDAVNSLPRGCAYIHGDYDLYAVIHKDDLSNRSSINALFDKQSHKHGLYWPQLEAFINGRIKIDMIQHGSQENFSGHTDEVVDIFAPFPEFDLQHRKTINIANMRQVFLEMFDNRKTLED